ncbi:MAG: hypothetical protein ACYTGP_04555 [Planctomycetota bacterium]|jgi:hypothetical protein
MPDLASPTIVWFMIALVITWFAIGTLKVIGYEYYNAVLWHNLRIQVQDLRREQKQKISRLQRDQGEAPAPRDRGRAVADPVSPDDVDAAANAREGIELREAA